MATPDLSTLLSTVADDGCAITSIELDDARRVRFQPPNPQALAGVAAIPPSDADINAKCDLLRQQLRRALRINHGPPLFVIQTLAGIYGYGGPTITTQQTSLRVLVQLPRFDEVNWKTIISIVDGDGNPTLPPASASAATATTSVASSDAEPSCTPPLLLWKRTPLRHQIAWIG